MAVAMGVVVKRLMGVIVAVVVVHMPCIRLVGKLVVLGGEGTLVSFGIGRGLGSVLVAHFGMGEEARTAIGCGRLDCQSGAIASCR